MFIIYCRQYNYYKGMGLRSVTDAVNWSNSYLC